METNLKLNSLVPITTDWTRTYALRETVFFGLNCARLNISQ